MSTFYWLFFYIYWINFFQYHLINLSEDVPDDYCHQLISPIIGLIETGNREVIKACLGFIKVIMTIKSEEFFKPHLELAVNARLFDF